MPEVTVTTKNNNTEETTTEDEIGYASSAYSFQNDLLRKGWELSSNKSQWHSADQIQKTLKISGIKNVKTKAVKKVIPKFFKIGGKVCAVVNGSILAVDVISEASKGNYYTAGAHILVFGIEDGLNLVPYVGPFLSIGATMLEVKYGDDLYKFTEKNLDNK